MPLWVLCLFLLARDPRRQVLGLLRSQVNPPAGREPAGKAGCVCFRSQAESLCGTCARPLGIRLTLPALEGLMHLPWDCWENAGAEESPLQVGAGGRARLLRELSSQGHCHGLCILMRSEP